MHRLVALVVVFGCGKSDSKPKPVEVKPSPVVADEPAPVPNEEGVLRIPATKKGEQYELRLGKGRILLYLDKYMLVAPDPKSGAAALEVLAKWLGVPVPKQTHSQPLQPLSFEMIGLGENDNKVFFSRGAEYAEMYINIRDAEHIVEFSPKDSGYAAPLADMFADALRDGPAPPRTMKNDPNLASETPMFQIGREVVVAGAHKPTCIADGYLLFAPNKTGETVAFAQWGGAPARVCDVPGAIDEIAAAPNSPIVVAIVTGRDPKSHVIGGDQKSTMWSIGPTGCHALALPKDVKLGPFTWPFLSPTGSDVAFAENGHLRTIPTGKGTPTSVPIGDIDLLYSWDTDGIQLVDLEIHRSRAQPGKAPEKIEHASTISPDGAYTVTFLDGALDVKGKKFTPAFRSDIRAIERASQDVPRWLAPHTLVLSGSPSLALDVTTLKARPLVGGTAKLVCGDSTHVLLSDGEHLAESK